MTPPSSRLGSNHPYEVAQALSARYGPDLELTFSRYQIGPSGDQENRRRTIFKVRAGEVDEAWIEFESQKLSPDEEIAFHSSTRLKGKTLHIPMIDFASDCSAPLCREYGLQALTCASVPDPGESFVYESGRSFHFYAAVLLEPDRWMSYLGALLLLDPPDTSPHVDIRWLGHTLRHETPYTSLRWTNHTARYLRKPGQPGA